MFDSTKRCVLRSATIVVYTSHRRLLMDKSLLPVSFQRVLQLQLSRWVLGSAASLLNGCLYSLVFMVFVCRLTRAWAKLIRGRDVEDPDARLLCFAAEWFAIVLGTWSYGFGVVFFVLGGSDSSSALS